MIESLSFLKQFLALFQCGEFKFPDVSSPLNKILSRPPRNRVSFSNSDAAGGGTDYAGYGGGGCATATGGYNAANNGLNGLASSLKPQSETGNGERESNIKPVKFRVVHQVRP